MTALSAQEAAQLIAAHALEIFTALTLLGLLLAAALWALVARLREPLWRRSARLWQGFASSRAAQRLPWLARLRQPRVFSVGYLLMDLALGFALALGALSLFLELADETGVDEELGRFDDALARAFADTLATDTLQVFAWITRLGDASTQYAIGIAVTLLLLLRRQGWLAASWVAAVAGNGLLTRALKVLFERQRPLHAHGLITETSFSFPSGHASGAMAIYGMLAYLLIRFAPRVWHLPVALTAVALILSIGMSRVVLQVHYLSDVLAGFASASAWLFVCIATAEVVRARQQGPGRGP